MTARPAADECAQLWTRALDATATTGGGLSPMSDRCHSLQGRVMDALAEVVSDRRLATVVPLETLPWLPTSTCWPRGTCSDSRRGEVRGVGPQLAAQEGAR